MSIWRQLLNLPEPTRLDADQPSGNVQTMFAPDTEHADELWVRPAPSSIPTVPDSTGRKWWTRILRGVAVAVLILILLVGARTMFFPTKPTPAPPLPAAATFPQAAASAAAERFAEAYFTWDQKAPENRARAIGQVAQSGVDSGFGWDGAGKSTAGTAHTVTVDVLDRTHATITVAVPVTAYKQERHNTWVPGTPRTTGLAVPVVVTGSGPVVSGLPAAVGLPDPGKAKRLARVQADDDLTRSTVKNATAFFTAYGRDRDVSALTAPDARITGLGGALTFKNLTDWQVLPGSKTTRTASATVRWSTPNGALLEQTYRVHLTRVTAASSSRWQVTELTVPNTESSAS